MKKAFRDKFTRGCMVVCWILVWQALSLLVGNEILLAGPITTLLALKGLVVTGAFWLSVGASLVRILLGFALGFAIYFFRQRRIMARKNKALTKQIAEANVYKTKYASAFEALPQPEPQSGTAAESDKTINLAATDDDTHIFDVLSKVILNEKLYLDPTFGRQSLMDRFGLSKEKVGAAFAKGSMHGSLTAFVNECRMDHAIKLLNERDDLSIKQIAEESGYYSANTFGRNFKAKYAISPTDYRNSKNA